MTHTEARELASQFGSRMCDENGDTHGEELYCFSLDDIIAIKKALAQRKPLLASEIVTMYAERPTSDNDMIEFARAIESAHGIKGDA